ncbi:MAG TPA: ABATE domain-containing protein [Thermoanaerobaculaceae bacterium]|nr:ABATE domain-containing protein [Thermoanaerobaculaceae bacterium]
MDPIWAELINSDWHDHLGRGRRADRIGDDRWLAAFLAAAGWRGRRLPGAADRGRLRSLRAVLRRIVDASLAGAVPAARDVGALNRALGACPAVRRLRRGGRARWVLEWVAVPGGIERALGAVAASFAGVLAAGEPDRIRVCANPDCRWVFFDGSRNRTRRWCEAGVCGSLVKVRRFRARRRSGAD